MSKRPMNDNLPPKFDVPTALFPRYQRNYICNQLYSHGLNVWEVNLGMSCFSQHVGHDGEKLA